MNKVLYFALLFAFNASAANIDIHIGASTGFGTIKNKDQSLRERLMHVSTLSVSPVFNYQSIALGLSAELQLFEQVADAKVKLGEDLRGLNWLVGPSIYLYFSDHFQSQLSAYTFLGEYNRRAKTNSGLEQEFADPLGFSVNLKYEIFPQFYLGPVFYYLAYREAVNQGQSVDITDNHVSYWLLALVVNYRFSILSF